MAIDFIVQLKRYHEKFFEERHSLKVYEINGVKVEFLRPRDLWKRFIILCHPEF